MIYVKYLDQFALPSSLLTYLCTVATVHSWDVYGRGTLTCSSLVYWTCLSILKYEWSLASVIWFLFPKNDYQMFHSK